MKNHIPPHRDVPPPPHRDDPSPSNIFQAVMQLIRNWPRPLKNALIIFIALLAVGGAAWGLLPATTKDQAVKWIASRFYPQKVVEVRTVKVGSMDFPEQYTVGEIIAQILEAKGIKVDRLFKQSDETVRSAIERGSIDCYMEYTGVPYTLVLHNKPISDPNMVYESVKEYYGKKHIEVSKPFNFQNEWAILIRGADSRKKHIWTISQAAKYAPNWRAGFVAGFNSGADSALDGMKQTYQLRFGSEQTITSPDDVYPSLKDSLVDIVSASSTDGELHSGKYDVVKLEDDRHQFPPYNPIILVRNETLERVPELREVMVKLPEIMTLVQMETLNQRVWAKPDNLTEIVQDWLKANGLISK